MSRIYFETIGCPKNREDTERMAGLLHEAGHEAVHTPEQADYIVVNTCGFIEDAKKESIETIFSMIEYKQAEVDALNDEPLDNEIEIGTPKNISLDHKKVIVTGCLTQRYSEELANELPEVDAILGVNDYGRLPGLIETLQKQGQGGGANANIPVPVFASKEGGILTGKRLSLDPRYVSYLKVGEGCSNACTYCIIPKIRGPYRSLPMDSVIGEARTLAKEGARELILIAQDVTYYGTDLYGKSALPELLRKLCHDDELADIQWIRLLYCYEERITDELISVMAEEPKICNYIDIPIQHVADTVLTRMNRHSTKASIMDTIKKLRFAMPDIAIRTTLITGFPGETDAEFSELKDFVMSQRLSRLGVFCYSREEDTVAYNMDGQVPKDIAEKRRDELMRYQMDISLEQNEAQVGRILSVIIDDIEDEYYLGRTRADAPEIDNAVMVTDPNGRFASPAGELNKELIGEIVSVRIVDAMDYDLVGEFAE